MLPQCAQVNFCVFTVAVRQRFSSIVFPVSVSFAVEGQRTSKLLMFRPVFVFGLRGGSKKNLVAMSESINDASFGGVVGRHLHFHPVADRKANETLAHFAGNVRENEMVVRQRDAKHGPGEHRHNGALQFDGLFRIHHVVDAFQSRRGRSLRPLQTNRFTGDYRQKGASRRKDADALRVDALRSQLMRGR